MKIIVNKESWEHYLNIVNYLCVGQKTQVKLFKNKNKSGDVKLEGQFIALESYLSTTPTPVIALILGSKEKVKSTYFIKSPTKIRIDKGNQGVIHQVKIALKDGSNVAISFNFEQRHLKQKPLIYHHLIK